MLMNRYIVKVGTPVQDALENYSTENDNSNGYVMLVDTTTSKTYKLYVANGELTMSEVTN
jgi:hypothetical protein